MSSSQEILVSIRCTVYNHEPFLRRCLDGFVMQKTSFRYEAIVHDDASTDGSVGIIQEYAAKYPDIIIPIIETENQYSKHDGTISRLMTEKSRGKYFAVCEGDDYWTDPLKLQNQVDYLETHPDCMLCFTNAIIHWDDASGKPDRIFAPDLEERDYDGPEMVDNWITPTASFVYRSSVLETDFFHYVQSVPELKIAGDIPVLLTCKHLGTVHAINAITCVYRKHPNGFMMSSDSKRKILVGDYRYALHKVFGKEYLDSTVNSALYHYRRGLYLAKKESNKKNYLILLGRILFVYLRHPISSAKRILRVIREKKAFAGDSTT